MEDVLTVYQRPYDPKHPVVCADESNKELRKTPRGTLPAGIGQADLIVVVADNLNTHSSACLYVRFEPLEARRLAKRFEWHYTPEHGPWLNMAEIELSVLSRQCLAQRIPDKDTLPAEVSACETSRNN